MCITYRSLKNKLMEHKKTKAGYLRYAKDKDGRLRFEHCIVWENNNGKIPIGMQVHHKDFNKTNNNIENLQLVTPFDHKRLHSGCILINGEWYKPCKTCGEFKKCDKENWYFSRGWITGKICKKCFIKKSMEVRKDLISKGWKRKNYTKAKPRLA